MEEQSKKVCVVTGSRADYGLLRRLMRTLDNDSKFELQVIVTGEHLSTEFGLTSEAIEEDGFNISRKVEMLLSADTPSAITKSTGIGLIGFADVMAELGPSLVVILGDRFEMLAASIAATFARIPIAHISGGETTTGAYDEAIRHSITKMSWWHFVAAEEYKNRVIQLGEDPSRVFLVGGIGVENILKTQLLPKNTLEKKIGFEFGKRNLLVTYHPVTLEQNTEQKDFQAILDTLGELKQTKVIFTFSNSDVGGRFIQKMIQNYVHDHQDTSIAIATMGHLNYLSALQYVDGVIGNSSSGISEAPSFKIGTINIGDRQTGRIKADSIIDCKPTKKSIQQALKKLFSEDFQTELLKVVNPYGDGSSTDKIIDVLRASTFPNSVKKCFYDQ